MASASSSGSSLSPSPCRPQSQRSRSSSPERRRTSRSPARERRHIEEPYRVCTPSSKSSRRKRSRWSSGSISLRRSRSRSSPWSPSPQYQSRLRSHSRSPSPRESCRRSGSSRSPARRRRHSRSPRFSRSPIRRSRSPCPRYGSKSKYRGRLPHCRRRSQSPTQPGRGRAGGSEYVDLLSSGQCPRSTSPKQCTVSRLPDLRRTAGLEQMECSVLPGLPANDRATAPPHLREGEEASRTIFQCGATRVLVCAMPVHGGDICYVGGDPLFHKIDTSDPELLRLATQGEIGGVVLGGLPPQDCLGKDLRKTDTQAMAPRSMSGKPRSGSSRSKPQEARSGAPVLSGGKGSWHTDKLEFFWGSQSPFSQHYTAPFTLDGVTFTCTEQYMMYHKANMFGAFDVASSIMETSDSVQMKKLGRLVPNFDAEVWEGECRKVVRDANVAKFSQNLHLMKQLKETHPRLLVEASPVDRKWGIGIASDHPLATQPDQWPGENLLGIILTDVRDGLMALGL